MCGAAVGLSARRAAKEVTLTELESYLRAKKAAYGTIHRRVALS